MHIILEIVLLTKTSLNIDQCLSGMDTNQRWAAPTLEHPLHGASSAPEVESQRLFLYSSNNAFIVRLICSMKNSGRISERKACHRLFIELNMSL
jgi:hypothetical protein